MNRLGRALKCLQTIFDDDLPCYPLFERDKNLANLRNDPRFAALESKLKRQWGHLPKYSRFAAKRADHAKWKYRKSKSALRNIAG